MPNYAAPGHPYSAQSIYVTVNPVYKNKSKSGSNDFQPSKLPRIHSSKYAKTLNLVKPIEEPRAQSAQSTYRYPPHVDHQRKLITNNFIQNTPWCRDMRRWFTPDRAAGIWFEREDYDRFRKMALDFRVPAGQIYHVERALLPGYSGYVPDHRFRFGMTWGRETVNAKRVGIPRHWESTSYFQDRPIGA